MSTEFQREDRYIVIKRTDLKKVPVSYRSHLVDPMFSLLSHLPHRECLVIESDWPEYEPTWAAIEARVTGKSAQQHYAEPVAWMVGSAIWWTKEQAELDSKEVGEPVIALGPCADPGEVERLSAQFKDWQASHHRNYCKAADQRDQLRGQLEKARKLLHTASIRLARWLSVEDDPRKQIIEFLEASAEPSAPLPPVESDLLPAIGSKVLIHLAREDKWVEHTVVGYYAWDNLRPDPSLHRVFVRVRDDQGYLNARMLGDIRPVGAAPGRQP